MSRRNDITKLRHLGVLRADGMGDSVLTSGLLRELRQQLPEARITFVCQEMWASWMRDCPWVDDVIGVRMSSEPGLGAASRATQLVSFVRRVWPLDLEMLINPGTLFE